MHSVGEMHDRKNINFPGREFWAAIGTSEST